MTDERVPDRIQSELGAAVETRAPAERDSLDGVLPAVVAAPRTAEAAQELVAFCGRERLAVIPRGGGTRWHTGARAQRFDVLLSTEHLAPVFEHDEGNATVTAGAGITIAALNEAVGRGGQFVPIDAPAGATLGGVLAANAFGPSRLKYGMPRDLVVGLHAALSDGRLVKAGSKVVKNVSGYDLNKLFINSWGGLGLITQVTLRLRPHDAASAGWSMAFDSWDEAQRQAFAIIDGPFEPTSLTVASHGEGASVHARFDGAEAAVRVQLDRLPQSHDLEPLSVTEAAPVVLRAVTLLREAPKWAQLARTGGAADIYWEAGNGIVTANFQTLPDVASLRAAAVQAGGFLVVMRAPAEMKTPELVWGQAPGSIALARSLKAKYDTAGVFSPGRGWGAV